MGTSDSTRLCDALREAARRRLEARLLLEEADVRLGRVAHEAIRAGMRVSEVGEVAGLDRATLYESLRRLGVSGRGVAAAGDPPGA